MIDITGYLHQKVRIYRNEGSDVYGNPKLTAFDTVPARFISVSRIVRLSDGQEKRVDAELWLEPSDFAGVDRVVEYLGVRYRIIDAEQSVDIHGVVNHSKLILQLIA